MIYSRMAPKTADFAPQKKTISILIELIKFNKDDNKRVLYNTLSALAVFSGDKITNLPTMITEGAIEVFTTIMKMNKGASPILRPVLEVLLVMASFMTSKLKERFVKCGLHDILVEMSSDNRLQQHFKKSKSIKKSYGDIAMKILFELSATQEHTPTHINCDSVRAGLVSTTTHKVENMGDVEPGEIAKFGVNERSREDELCEKSFIKNSITRQNSTIDIVDFPVLLGTRPKDRSSAGRVKFIL